MDEKTSKTRPRSMSLRTYYNRRRRFFPLAVLGVMALLYNYLPQSYISDLSFPSGTQIQNIAAVRQKVVSAQEQDMLQDIPSTSKWSKSKEVSAYTNEEGVAAMRQKSVSAQEQSILQDIPLENRPAKNEGQSTSPSTPEAQEVSAAEGKVSLEAHIMSKCPDAQYCLEKLVVPTMAQVSDLVNFTLAFIGEVDEQNGLHCMHGETECLGDMLLACVDSLYPERPVISLGFANCLIADYEEIPARSLVEGCAMEHAVDFDQLNKCVSEGGQGEAMLRESMLWSKSLGVTKSCTVRVNGQQWCVRDGGEWKGCDKGGEVTTLVDKIKTLAKSETPLSSLE